MSAEYISGDVELSVFPNDAKFFTVIRNAPSTFGYYDQNETPIWTYIYDSGVGIASIRGETLSAPVYFGEIQNPIADGDTPYIESIETQAVFNESKNRYFLENTVNVNNPSAVGVNSGLRDIWYSLATPSCTEMTIYIKDELDNVNNPGGTFTVTESVPMLKNFSEKGQYFVDTLLITTNTGADYTYGFEVNNMTIGNSTRRCRFRNVFLNPPWPIVEGEFSFDAKEDLMSNIFMEGNLDDASFELVGNLSEILSIDQNGVITGSLDFDNIAIPYTISYPHISQLGGQVETKNISGYLKIVDSDGIFAHLSLSLGFYAADN